MMSKLGALFGFEEEVSLLGLVVGPILLMLTIVLVLQVPCQFNYDLLFIAVFGLFLTAKWKIRGCIAALLLLAFSAGAKHVLVPSHHAWQAGLEGSVAMALFISGLVFEGSSKWAFSKLGEIERNEKTILFLEEDLSQQKELAAKEFASTMEKLEALRIQSEELQADLSTLQVLNDVLRKTTAKSIEEKEGAQSRVLHFDRKEGLLLEEINSLQTELQRLGNESVLMEQNKQLFQELNETRTREAQTHLINETLVRLHAKEHQKARELEAKFIEAFTAAESREVELLYQQLKVQFEQKNQILHQARRELFQTDTELQTVRKQLQEKELEENPVPKDLYREIDSIAEENLALQQEALELQALVSHLMQSDSSIVKKKVLKKTPPPSFEQVTLF